MKTLALKLLLLVNFVYWASGLALCVHERMEHAHEAAPAATADDEASSLVSARQDSSPPLQVPDNHDDCPTCQMLKLMKAQPSAPLILPQPSEPCVEVVAVISLQARSLSFVQFLPARAPPGYSSLD